MSSPNSLAASREDHIVEDDPKCPNCNIEIPVTGLDYCVKCATIVLKLHQKRQAEKIERRNQNAEKISDLNVAMEKALTSSEQAAFLEFIPEEARDDAKEILDILKGYIMSKHIKNKSRKEDEVLSKITHLFYGYKTPAIVITAQHVVAPQSLKKKMEVIAKQMEVIHPTHVNYLVNGTRMLQSVLSGVSDVKRTTKNQESILSEKVEREFKKIQLRKKKKDDHASGSEHEPASDCIESEEEVESEGEVVIPLLNGERSESVVDSSPHTGSRLNLPLTKKLLVHYPIVRNKSKEPLSKPQSDAWNPELNMIASTPKLTKAINDESGYNDASGSFEEGMRQMPLPYDGYQARPDIATLDEDTMSAAFMSPIVGNKKFGIVGAVTGSRLSAIPTQSTLKCVLADRRKGTPGISALPHDQTSHVSSHHTSTQVIPQLSQPPSNTKPDQTCLPNTPAVNVPRSVQNHPQTVALGDVSLGSPLESVRTTTIDQPGLQPRGVKRKGLFQRLTDKDAHSEDDVSESTFRFAFQVQQGVIVEPPGGGSSEPHLNNFNSYSAPVEKTGMEVEDTAALSMEIESITGATPDVTPVPKIKMCNPAVPPPAQPQMPAVEGFLDEQSGKIVYRSSLTVTNVPSSSTESKEVTPSSLGEANKSYRGTNKDDQLPWVGPQPDTFQDDENESSRIKMASVSDSQQVFVGNLPHNRTKQPMGGLGERASQVEQERIKWLEQHRNFMMATNTPIKHPTIAKKELDLYKFYQITKDEGGFVECVKNKRWKNIADKLEIGPSTNLTFKLRKHYENYILPYECHFDRGGADPTSILAEVEAKKKNLKPQFPDKSQVIIKNAAIGETVEDSKNIKMNFVADSFINDEILNLSQDLATPSLK